MQRVLILAPPEDLAARAVSLAADLASRAELEVLLVRALQEADLRPLGNAEPEDAERLRSLLVECEAQRLEGLAAPLRGLARKLTTRVLWGAPWEVVLDLVRSCDIDLVVKPARGLSRAGRVFFGATALHLFRSCPCPVWVVGDEGRLPRRILAAVDPGEGPKRRAIGQHILGWAQRIATLAGAELHVVSCWDAPAAEMLKDRLTPEEVGLYKDDASSRALEGFDEILRSVDPPLPPERAHLLEGEASELLPRLVKAERFDLTVMGTLGRPGVSEILGETTELVVRAVRSSVLTVPPGAGPPPDSR